MTSGVGRAGTPSGRLARVLPAPGSPDVDVAADPPGDPAPHDPVLPGRLPGAGHHRHRAPGAEDRRPRRAVAGRAAAAGPRQLFADVFLQWLFVSRPIFVAQTLGLLVQFLAIVAVGRVVPGVAVDGATTAVWAAVLLTILNSLFAELVAVSDDNSYYGVLVRRLVARNFKRAAESTPGLLVVQVDGLSLPVLRHAMSGGRVPVLGGLVRDGAATLHPWIALLPPTTPASQAGILHGRNDGIAGFRWYEKATARLLVANHPDDAAEIVRRVSDGTGLLADDGASIGNLLTGDAPRSYLTMATIGEGAPSDDARRLRGFLATSVNYLRLLVLMVGEMAKELYQAERQRARSIEPRMHRDLHYAVERAVTNIALRTTSTAFVIEEMYRGAPTIYVDYTGYDAIAHHCGPEREEAIDALDGIDRAIGSLLKAGRVHQPGLSAGRALGPRPVPGRDVQSAVRPAARGDHRRAAAGQHERRRHHRLGRIGRHGPAHRGRAGPRPRHRIDAGTPAASRPETLSPRSRTRRRGSSGRRRGLVRQPGPRLLHEPARADDQRGDRDATTRA